MNKLYFLCGVSLALSQLNAAEVDVGRWRRLNSIAEQIKERPLTTRSSSAENSSGIALFQAEGRAFVGNQLEFFDQSEAGAVRASKPAWIYLYWTEGRDFTLTGEVQLGGEFGDMLFPGDLPDGFALFLREWDGVHRYQLDSRRVIVKRRLFLGQVAPGIEHVAELPEPVKGQWIPFSVAVSQAAIQYRFGQASATLNGPLHTDGANKIAIAPGTKLRNLRLSFGAGAPTPKDAEPALSKAPATSSPAANAGIVNGGFEMLPESRAGDQTGQFGEAMFSPSSKLLPGWVVSDGLVGLRNNPPSPAGGLVLELGPRNTPGTVSQTVRTEPGKAYELSFLLCDGRGANNKVKVRIGEETQTIECPQGSSYQRKTINFEAGASKTTISFSGIGSSGFGPMIDDVHLKRSVSQ